MKIDPSPYENAIRQLENSLSYLNSQMSRDSADLREQFRAAVIQAFGFTYDLAYKMVRRQLEQILSNPSDVDTANFMDLMRTAQEAGLVRDAVSFRHYREKRNITSHTYDSAKAEQVIEGMDGFVKDARFILKELKSRNA